MSRFWKITLIVIALIVVLGVSFRLLHKPGGGKPHDTNAAAGGTQGKDGEPDDKPVPVTVVPVETQNVPVYLTALGTVQALNTVTVSPQVAGQLLRLNFDEGREVKQGEVLAEIDPRTFQAQYDQAVAKKRQDTALLSTDRTNYERSKDPAVAKYLAKQNLDQLRNQVAQDQAAIASDDAAIRDAKVQLDYTKVRAPISGLAGIRAVDPGNIISIGTAIVTLTEVHPINVIFNLPEQNVEMVRSASAAGKPLQVSVLDSAASKVIAAGGTLTVIDNQIDSTNGTFKLKARFPNAENTLFPGQFVNVQLKVNTVDGGLVIPTQAVQRGPDGDFVYMLKPDSTVAMQPVTSGQEVGDSHVMITKGIKAGDQVVTEGQFRLKPGSKVKALKPGEVPPAPTADELKQDAQKDKKSGKRGRRG